MATALQPRHDRAYWEGVRDGVAEMTQSVADQYRDGIRLAEADHSSDLPPELDLIRRDKVIEFLRTQARDLEGLAAKVAAVIEGQLGDDPRGDS